MADETETTQDKATAVDRVVTSRPWVEDGVEIHDHFDGSAHCIQCDGNCTLTGEKRLLTEMIRWLFDQWVRGYCKPDQMELASLAKHGVRIEECYNRASSVSSS